MTTFGLMGSRLSETRNIGYKYRSVWFGFYKMTIGSKILKTSLIIILKDEFLVLLVKLWWILPKVKSSVAIVWLLILMFFLPGLHKLCCNDVYNHEEKNSIPLSNAISFCLQNNSKDFLLHQLAKKTPYDIHTIILETTFALEISKNHHLPPSPHLTFH